MGKSKKAFIDRKKVVTFHVVHRSQHDPLVTDENAPQRVLVESRPNAQQQSQTTNSIDTTKRREEQLKYGILYDDDYDYLQHLKKPEQETVWEFVENPNHTRKRIEEKNTPKAKLQLPSSVFASEFEEDEGMLNKAAPHPGPRLDWDPDVVAALDDDFNYDDQDNQLEDDFVLQAMGDENEGSDVESSEGEEDNSDIDSNDLSNSASDDEDEMLDKLGALFPGRRFNDEETKSRFTEYSMSSSVIRRNEQLSLLDDRFEHFYATYDDPELGDLAMEDIEGSWHQKHPYVLGCFKEFKKSKEIEDYKKEWDRERLERYRNIVDGDEDPNDEFVEYEVPDEKAKKWDCESIISTYSKTCNLPHIIEEKSKYGKNNSEKQQKIIIDPKTGLPINVLRGEALTEKALANLATENGIDTSRGPKSLCAKSVLSTLSVLSIRPKDETPEEKRERKRLLKEYRKERRIEKKMNSEAFKEEKKRQIDIKINQRINQNFKKINI